MKCIENCLGVGVMDSFYAYFCSPIDDEQWKLKLGKIFE